MGIFKDIKSIKAQMETFNNKTLKRAQYCEDRLKLLDDLKLSVKKAIVVQNSTSGKYEVHIEYNIPSVTLTFDENNNESQDLMMRSINLLDLIPIKDQMMLSAKIQEAKEKNAEL